MECPRLSLPPLSAPGEVVTFYSYKGGTGRTMALSNIAVLLARRENASVPVLMLDWDMEAPGLHHYFGQQEECPGVLEFFEACRAQLERSEAGQDDALLAQRVLEAIDWQQYVVRVDQGSPLYLMRAGRFDASYSERLAQMRWDRLFDACPALFRCFADTLARHFRYVLVDSRTGRTDSAGICTTLLPKKLVVVFTPNRQSLEGVDALVTRAIAYRRSHEDEQRPLLVYPLPSRIEMGDGVQRAEWRRGDTQKGIAGYQPMFERLLRSSYGLPQITLDSYFDEVQLQQTKTFAYGEQLAVRLDQGGDRFSLTRTFEAFLQWLTGGYFPWQSSREIGLLAAIEEARRALHGEPGRAVGLPLARDLARLGELYRKDGRPAQALDAFRQSVEIRTRLLGDEHVDTLAVKSGMARLLRQLDALDEARQLEQDVADTRERLHGPEHADTLAARACLAQTLARQGDYAAALSLQDGVLASYARQLGAEHPLTLGAMDCRATTLLHMGLYGQAQQVLETVVAARTRLFGAEHGDTLRSKLVLAQVLTRQGDLDAARWLLAAVLQAQERTLGLDHPATLATRDRLAGIVAGLDDWAGAESLLDMIAMLQALIEREQYLQAGELADDLKSRLLRSGVPGKLRKRGMAQLKRMYKLQGDFDSLLALQEDEVQALEGALSEARIEQR